jgi:hypothetical protein
MQTECIAAPQLTAWGGCSCSCVPGFHHFTLTRSQPLSSKHFITMLSWSRGWCLPVSGNSSDCDVLNFGLDRVHVTLARDVGQLTQRQPAVKYDELRGCRERKQSCSISQISDLDDRCYHIPTTSPLKKESTRTPGSFDTTGSFDLIATKEKPLPSKIPNISGDRD